MTLLPGMPPPPDPDATKGCESHCIRGLVERDDGSFYPCPTHRPAAFEKWSKGEYPGWKDATGEPSRLSL
jgi:hypothetical protein